MTKPKLGIRMIMTLAVIVAAVIAVFFLYRRYTAYPWTRDGQVSADTVLMTPRVSGHVTRVAVTDNQLVKKGGLLFEIDPRSYRIQLASRRVQLDEAREQVDALEAAVTVAKAGVEAAKANLSSAKARIEEAKAQIKAAEGGVDEAKAGVEAAQATVVAGEATVRQRVRNRDRAKKLADDGSGSVSRAESTLAAWESATATLTAARADVVAARATESRADAGLAQAQAALVVAEAGLGTAEAQVASALASLAQAQATLGVRGENNVRIRNAKENLKQAELELEWTAVRAPTDGYVTNLVVKLGDYATAGKQMLALVGAQSFYVLGFFQETDLRRMKPGDRAVVTLMAHTDQPLEGEVESIGLAINPPDVAQTGRGGDNAIVPQVQPSFDWIRLAQRVPVRIKLTEVPEGVQLIGGTTASVAIVPKP